MDKPSRFQVNIGLSQEVYEWIVELAASENNSKAAVAERLILDRYRRSGRVSWSSRGPLTGVGLGRSR